MIHHRIVNPHLTSTSLSFRPLFDPLVNEFVNSSMSSSIRHWVRQFVNEFVNTSSIHHWKFVNIDELDLVRQWVCQFVPYSIIWSLSSSWIRYWVRQSSKSFWIRQSSSILRRSATAIILKNLTCFVNISSIQFTDFINSSFNLANSSTSTLFCHRTQFVTAWVRQFGNECINLSIELVNFWARPRLPRSLSIFSLMLFCFYRQHILVQVVRLVARWLNDLTLQLAFLYGYRYQYDCRLRL